MSQENSLILQYIKSKNWQFKPVSDDKVELEVCPFCKKSNYGHFYINVENSNKGGLYLCHVCGASGNFSALKTHMGDVGNTSNGHVIEAQSNKKVETLADVQQCHQALLEDEDALDYLINGRGFSQEIISKQKIGLTKRFFRDCGEVRAIVYPYLVGGQAIFTRFRTLPTMPLAENKVPKAFSSPTGHEAPLYNGEIIREGLKEIVLVEGESNTIALLDKGVSGAVGVPGANVRKATWLTLLDSISDLKIYIAYDNDRVGNKAAQELAARIGIEKCYKIKLPDFTVTTDSGEVRQGKDVTEWFTSGGTLEGFEKLKKDAKLFDVTGVASSMDCLDLLEESFEGKEGLSCKYLTPWPSLNKLVGFDNGDIIDLVAAEKIGKASGLDAMVKTLTGWKRMGDIQVGDKLASVDGAPSEVTHVWPQGKLPMFKVVFTDGRSTKVTANHLWKVADINQADPEWNVYTTNSIIAEYRQRNWDTSGLRKQLHIPLVSGDFGHDNALPVDPWLLGALIGDGSITGSGPGLTSADAHIVDKARLVVEALGGKLTDYSHYHYGISGEARVNLKNNLAILGLWGTTCETKFIPREYLEANRAARINLLQGLMDTDGTAGNKHGTASYTTISKRLATDFQELVRSLGGICQLRAPTKKQFRYKGEMRTGQPAYLLIVRLPKREEIFSLPRKTERVHPRTNMPRLKMTNIVALEPEEAQCITVSHPSSLYITDDYIVTHNSKFSMNLIEHMVDTYKEDGIIICMEMPVVRVTRSWVSMVTGTPDNIPTTPEEATKLLVNMKAAVKQARHKAANREGTLYFCYPQIKDIEDMYTLIKDVIRRYGVQWFVIDNLQLLCDKTLKNAAHRTIHLSQISKMLTGITKDHGVKMIRILQPHRVREGSLVTTDNIDGSSQIAKDSDAMLTLNRGRVNELSAATFATMGNVQSASAFDSRMLVTVGLSRYSSGGCTTLTFDGATSTVTEYNVVTQAVQGQGQPVTSKAQEDITI